MRVNQPVSNTEIPVPADVYLVSQTDLKGVITDANDAFIEISGFTRAELLGQPHNLVRHPDMPAAAFANMWDTLATGQPWRGIVKNRTKQGNYYWVDAQLSPIQKAGQTIGYMSVRRVASRQQIAEAKALYATLQSPNARWPVKRCPHCHLQRMNMALLGLALAGFWLAALLPLAPVWHWGLMLAASLLLAGALLFMQQRVFRPLKKLQQSLAHLAEGNLFERISLARPDEMGKLQNLAAIMQMRWLVNIDHSQTAIRQTVAMIERIGLQSSTINQQIDHQYDQISSSAAATEEFAQTVAEVANHAAATSEAAGHSQALVGEGLQTMAHGRDAMHQVVDAVQLSNRQLLELESAVEKVGSITLAIKEIADQTNLLALNAAIEAARAGEQGRGFAVVADEVRKLAERTTGSTQEISRTVEGIQRLAGHVASAMTQAGAAVDDGAVQISHSASQLETVAQSSQHTVSLAEHIALAAQQQNLAGQDMARSMESIAGLAQNNRDEITGLVGSLDLLRDNIGRMQEDLDEFRLFENSVAAHSLGKLPPAMQIAKAITAHGAWKVRLNKIISSGKSDAPLATISADNACAFGKWLYDQELPERVRQHPRYRQVLDLHARFHRSAGTVAQCACQGQQDEARKLVGLNGDFYRSSAELMQALTDWQNELH